MTLQDELPLATVSLRRADPESYSRRLAHLRAQGLSVDALRSPEAFSVGGEAPDGTEQPLARWSEALRALGAVEAELGTLGGAGEHPLPEHIRHAFAGGDPTPGLAVSVAGRRWCFALIQEQSPSYALTPAKLAQLIDLQPQPALLWARLDDLIAEHCALNAVPFDAQQTGAPRLLALPERSWETLGGQLVSELQVEAAANEVAFEIPEALRGCFERPVPLASFLTPMSGPARRPAYFWVEKTPTLAQLAEVVEAQPFAARVKEALRAAAMPEGGTAPFELDAWLQRVGAEAAGPEVANAVRAAAEEEGLDPLIPAGQLRLWGPGAAELRRIRARERTEETSWYLAPSPERWSGFTWRMAPEAVFEPASPGDLAAARTAFRDALQAARTFATELDSPFEERLRRAAEFLGEGAATALDEPTLATLVELGAPPALARDFHALELADVFGGMGSWNDQPVEASQSARYEEVSARLFSAWARFRGALLATFAREPLAPSKG